MESFLNKEKCYFILEYSRFTMSCSFQVYSKVIQLYICLYLFFFRYFSYLGYHRKLSRVPRAIQ